MSLIRTKDKLETYSHMINNEGLNCVHVDDIQDTNSLLLYKDYHQDLSKNKVMAIIIPSPETLLNWSSMDGLKLYLQ